MNYFGISEANTRRQGARRGTRPRATVCNGSGLAAQSQAIVKPAAAIEHPGIERSLRHLARRCCTPIRVTDLMEVAGLSRRGLLKSFRKHTGRAPGEVLRRLRIEHAKRLLAGRNLTLVQLAAAVGFRKTNSFSVAFKRVTGLAPMKYQRLMRAGGNGRGGRAKQKVTGRVSSQRM
jgi:transcriptional regulator GlxA family with amidase domain